MARPSIQAPIATTPANLQTVAELDELTEFAWNMADQRLLGLALTRVGQLLQCAELVDEIAPVPRDRCEAEARNAVSTWPTSSVLTDLERACLQFVEQFELDPSSVEQRHVDAVLAHLDTRSFFAFASAVYVLDARLRVLAVTRQLTPADPADGSGS